jgi:hypothetical protein
MRLTSSMESVQSSSTSLGPTSRADSVDALGAVVSAGVR